jgi:hypothetical protein
VASTRGTLTTVHAQRIAGHPCHKEQTTRERENTRVLVKFWLCIFNIGGGQPMGDSSVHAGGRWALCRLLRRRCAVSCGEARSTELRRAECRRRPLAPRHPPAPSTRTTATASFRIRQSGQAEYDKSDRAGCGGKTAHGCCLLLLAVAHSSQRPVHVTRRLVEFCSFAVSISVVCQQLPAFWVRRND